MLPGNCDLQKLPVCKNYSFNIAKNIKGIKIIVDSI